MLHSLLWVMQDLYHQPHEPALFKGPPDPSFLRACRDPVLGDVDP